VCHALGLAGREEAVARIRAAVDARAESGADILIVARSDARQADSLQARPCRIPAASAGSPHAHARAQTRGVRVLERRPGANARA